MLYKTSETLQATQHQLTFLSLKHTPYREKLFYHACVLLSNLLSNDINVTEQCSLLFSYYYWSTNCYLKVIFDTLLSKTHGIGKAAYSTDTVLAIYHTELENFCYLDSFCYYRTLREVLTQKKKKKV